MLSLRNILDFKFWLFKTLKPLASGNNNSDLEKAIYLALKPKFDLIVKLGSELEFSLKVIFEISETFQTSSTELELEMTYLPIPFKF